MGAEAAWKVNQQRTFYQHKKRFLPQSTYFIRRVYALHMQHGAHMHRYAHIHTCTRAHVCTHIYMHRLIHIYPHSYTINNRHTFNSLNISVLQLTAPTAVPKFPVTTSAPKLVPSHSDRGYYIGMLDSVERERCELKKKCFMLMQKRIEHQLETLRETSRRFEKKLHVRQEKAKV